jgi:hypothetical protein
MPVFMEVDLPLCGIIMITTKQGAAIKTNLESKTEFGSYSYLMQQITVSGLNPKNSYRLCLNAYNTDNDFPIRKGELIPEDSESIRKYNSKQQLSFSGAYSTRIAKMLTSFSTDYLTFQRELPGPLNLPIYIISLFWRVPRCVRKFGSLPISAILLGKVIIGS